MEQIKIREIIIGKNAKLGRSLPGWLIRFLERFISLPQINDILRLYSDRDPNGFIDGTFEYIGARYVVHNADRIPLGERLIFASNHPLGGLDGMALVRALSDYSNDGVKIVVNDLLMHLKPLEPVFIPVNKHGRQSIDYLNSYNGSFEQDINVITFPAGLCSRKIDGVIKDLPWKSSFVQKALATSRRIVPVYVDAKNTNFFYNLALLRKRLKIKANLEMIRLPKEVFLQKNKTFHIYIGDPIEVDNSVSAKEWANKIYDIVYNLKSQK